MADTRGNAPRPKNRPQTQQPPAVEEQEQVEQTIENADPDAARNLVWGRESKRRIKLHSSRTIMGSIDDAPVKTVGGAPDMRIAENRLGLMRDPSKKKNGDDDFRFLEHRPDLLALHAARGETFPNLLFDDQGNVEGAGTEVVGALEEE